MPMNRMNGLTRWFDRATLTASAWALGGAIVVLQWRKVLRGEA